MLSHLKANLYINIYIYIYSGIVFIRKLTGSLCNVNNVYHLAKKF